MTPKLPLAGAPAVSVDNISISAILGGMVIRDSAPESLLPLPPATFHILLALADEDRHGYAIIQEISARTNGKLKMSAGTLYRSVQRMLEQDLIVETEDRPDPEFDDERRRYYRITPFGRAVARAETSRMAELVVQAKASGLAPRRA
jgi:DNA-binding PadR family transcriptional regulator